MCLYILMCRISDGVCKQSVPVLNSIVAKEMGKIALIGFATAVADAVYDTTAKGIRELPITSGKFNTDWN